MARDNARRTFDPPVTRDTDGFFGRSRARYQRFNAKSNGQPAPDGPPIKPVPEDPPIV